MTSDFINIVKLIRIFSTYHDRGVPRGARGPKKIPQSSRPSEDDDGVRAAAAASASDTLGPRQHISQTPRVLLPASHVSSTPDTRHTRHPRGHPRRPRHLRHPRHPRHPRGHTRHPRHPGQGVPVAMKTISSNGKNETTTVLPDRCFPFVPNNKHLIQMITCN